jgi:hypothetical protein
MTHNAFDPETAYLINANGDGLGSIFDNGIDLLPREPVPHAGDTWRGGLVIVTGKRSDGRGVAYVQRGNETVVEEYTFPARPDAEDWT